MGLSASKTGDNDESVSLANYHIVEEKGMALAAEEFLKDSANGIADKLIFQLGRVIFTKRYVTYEPFENFLNVDAETSHFQCGHCASGLRITKFHRASWRPARPGDHRYVPERSHLEQR
jgi:hypothetical protein